MTLPKFRRDDPSDRNHGVRRRAPAALRLVICAVLATSLAAAGCGGGGGGGGGGNGGGGGGGGGGGEQPIDIETPLAERCEILDPDHCLLPFPSDALTVADATLGTGRRVHFQAESLPANTAGAHVDPSEWNRSDGFSPGAQITLVVPGLDAARSALPPITDIERSLDTISPIVLLDADTGERVPFFAEMDAATKATASPALLVHAARALAEGHRHVVALRGMIDGGGAVIEPSAVFRAYRDEVRTSNDAVEARRPAMERIFADLSDAGVERDDLYLAWDFTVASARSLSERLLHMRDDAFADLGDAAPQFTVDSVSDLGAAATLVRGTFAVPRYLTGAGEPGSTLNNGAGSDDVLPGRNGTQSANLICTVPKLAGLTGLPARMILYGHGLLGSANEVIGVGELAAIINVAFCATDWIGMASEDIGNAVSNLQDLSRFRSMPDRLQQAHLNFLFLGRLMRHPQGLSSHSAFQSGGETVLDTSDLFFLGASQGGILGGATTAIAQDWTRSVLAVGASNYSLLIPRSVDFDEFAQIFAGSYPDPLDRTIAFGLIQMLWDRGEANGYLQHVTRDPYPGTPVHDVLYLEAFGDHQVANVATEIAARTIGARVRQPALRPGRSTAVEPYALLEPVPSYPWPGSALVVWDFGTPAPPDENVPPREGEDPHGKAAEVPEVLLLVSEYLDSGGALVDVCLGQPCTTLE